MAVLGQDGFGMELDAFYRLRFMTKCHYKSVGRFG